jgi:hypothetical protein
VTFIIINYYYYIIINFVSLAGGVNENFIVPSGDFSCAVGTVASSHQMVTLNMSKPSDTDDSSKPAKATKRQLQHQKSSAADEKQTKLFRWFSEK